MKRAFQSDAKRQEYSVSDRPALVAFLADVEAARHPDIVGLVKMSGALVEAWQFAELEAGHPLESGGPASPQVPPG